MLNCTGLLQQRKGGSPVDTGCLKYTEYCKLFESLKSGHVVLVKGRWLAEQCFEEARPLPKRQELPPEALWLPQKLISRYENPKPNRRPPNLIVVSYCWYSKGHPDPDGEQMRLLGQILSWSHACPSRSKDTAVFLDWCSLYQHPRTPEQEDIFGEAMSQYLNVWYAHAKTDVFMLTKVSPNAENRRPYHERGWPTFEHRVSGLISQFRVSGDSGVYDLGRLTDEQLASESTSESWRGMHQVCAKGFSPPLTPEAFNEILAQKTFTCPTHDMGFCRQKFQQVFEETTAIATEMLYQGLDWGDENVQEFVAVLPNCRSLLCLSLRQNRIGDRGLKCLAAALPKTLRHLGLRNNRIGDAGAEELSKELPQRCPSIRVINLSGNRIGDRGVAFLADAVVQCENLQHLYLARNNFHDEGAQKLTKIIGQCRQLLRMDLQDNTLQASTVDTINWLWTKNGKLEEDLVISCEEPEDVNDSNFYRHVPLSKLRQDITKADFAQKTFIHESMSMTQLSLGGEKSGLGGEKSWSWPLNGRVFSASFLTGMDIGQAIPLIVAKLKDNTDCKGQIEAAKAVQVFAKGPYAQERMAEEQLLPPLLGLLSAMYTELRAAAAAAVHSLVNGNSEVGRLAIRDGAIACLVPQLSATHKKLRENAAMALWNVSIGSSNVEFLKSKGIQQIVELLATSSDSSVLQRASAGLVLNLSADASTHPHLISFGAIPALAGLLSRQDCCVRVQVLVALRRIVESQKGSEELVREFDVADVFPLLVANLRSEIPKEREAAARALRGLVRDSMNGRRLALFHGAMHRLAVPALLDSSETILLSVAMDVLWCLTDRAEAMLRHAGSSVRRLVCCLSFHDPEVKAEAARLLQQEIDSDEKRVEAVELGAVQHTLGMLRTWREDVLLPAAVLLRNLALNRSAKSIAYEEGALPLLNDLLSSSSTPLLEAVLRAMRNLATLAAVKAALGRSGTIPVLVDHLRSESAEVVEPAAGTLRNLVFGNGDNKQRALSAKCLPELISLLGSSPDIAVRLQAVGALINLISTSSDDVELSRHIQQEAAAAGAVQALEGLREHGQTSLLSHEQLRLCEQVETALKGLSPVVRSGGLLPLMPLAKPWTTTRTRKAGVVGSLAQRRTTHMPRSRSAVCV